MVGEVLSDGFENQCTSRIGNVWVSTQHRLTTAQQQRRPGHSSRYCTDLDHEVQRAAIEEVHRHEVADFIEVTKTLGIDVHER